MTTYARLKKEGIEVIEKLDVMKVNTIANNIASKLCSAFPEHNLNKSDLFESLARLNMYVAKMPADSSGAKYSYKDSSIFFNETSDIDEMSNLAVHECIHCIQELRDTKNNIIKKDFINGIILQLVTYHSSNDLKIVFLTNKENEPLTPTHERNYGMNNSKMTQEGVAWRLSCEYDNSIVIERLNMFDTASEKGQVFYRFVIKLEEQTDEIIKTLKKIVFYIVK